MIEFEIKDNPKLNCRLKNMEKFSPKRIVLDNKLETNTESYLIKTANKTNTIIFYNMANKSKILEFKKKKIEIPFTPGGNSPCSLGTLANTK